MDEPSRIHGLKHRVSRSDLREIIPKRIKVVNKKNVIQIPATSVVMNLTRTCQKNQQPGQPIVKLRRVAVPESEEVEVPAAGNRARRRRLILTSRSRVRTKQPPALWSTPRWKQLARIRLSFNSKRMITTPRK